jgi:AraC-like DNA-binding protein
MQIVKIKLSAALHQMVAEMAAQRFLSVDSFLTQTVDALAAAHRLQKYRAKHAPLPISAGAADPDPDSSTGHTQLEPAVIQKILHASPNLTIGQLSSRFNTSPTTVRRILATYQNASHNSLHTGRTGRPAHSKALSLTSAERAQP